MFADILSRIAIYVYLGLDINKLGLDTDFFSGELFIN